MTKTQAPASGNLKLIREVDKMAANGDTCGNACGLDATEYIVPP